MKEYLEPMNRSQAQSLVAPIRIRNRYSLLKKAENLCYSTNLLFTVFPRFTWGYIPNKYSTLNPKIAILSLK